VIILTRIEPNSQTVQAIHSDTHSKSVVNNGLEAVAKPAQQDSKAIKVPARKPKKEGVQVEIVDMFSDQEVGDNPDDDAIDVLEIQEQKAIQALRNDQQFNQKIHAEGVAWGWIGYFLKNQFPPILEAQEREERAFRIARKALDEILGPQNEAWHSFKNRENKTYVKAGRA